MKELRRAASFLMFHSWDNLWSSLFCGLITGVFLCCLSLLQIPHALAQPIPALVQQAVEGGPVEPLTPEELNQLKDPLFNLVIKGNPAAGLTETIQRLKPQAQSIFVVDEHIVDRSPKVNGRPAERRAVMTFQGNTAGNTLDQNVFLSVNFNSENFPSSSTSAVEAMAWNETAGTFNYYKFNRSGAETTPTWKFRGSSKDADLLSTSARRNTCMECHINGGPVMKELILPWNNWHSFSDFVQYLQPPVGGETAPAGTWPVAIAANSPLKNLAGAETLETAVIFPATERFNDRRIQAILGNRSTNIPATITDAKRLLKPLFVTTEFNLISSSALSSSHPFARSSSATPQPVSIPTSFFANSDLIGPGLGLFENLDFSFASVDGRAYQELVRRSETRLNGKTPGDANFAWFTPEASFIDNDFVQKLIQRQIIPRGFVAAALSVDLETPVLSKDRARLWSASNILPNQFKTGPSNDLIAQTIRNLEALKPSASSPEGQFLAALRSPDPVAFLRTRLNAYSQRERDRFANAQLRPQETARLYRKLLERRQAVLADATLTRLDETGGRLLLPVGTVAALPETVNDAVARPTLARGDRGPTVQQLQRLLQSLGLLSGPVDGEFGAGTERSVIAAQRQLALTADGVVGPATWAALERATTQATPNLPTLRQGDRGDAVVRLQKILRDRNFLASPADGDFGALTRAAVIRAQRQAGLEADGIVGPNTWAFLTAA